MSRPEQRIQQAVVEHLRLRGAPDLVYLHVPNGGLRSPIEAAIMKGMGVRKGASDLLIWQGGRSYAIELKAPGGKTTDSQLRFLQDLRKAGAQTAICIGLDEALAKLEEWGLVRGRVT